MLGLTTPFSLLSRSIRFDHVISDTHTTIGFVPAVVEILPAVFDKKYTESFISPEKVGTLIPGL